LEKGGGKEKTEGLFLKRGVLFEQWGKRREYPQNEHKRGGEVNNLNMNQKKKN